MPRKPHATEEEYFARQQALKREKLAKEEAARRAEEEREALKKLHWMRCPKCGQELKPFTTPIQQFQVERCESCQGMWFDSGELERLSEIEDAEVVIAGNKAAVGVEFDDQYQAGLDDRLRKIIKERVDGVISGITTVAITSDEGIRDAIESLGERLDTMSDMAALQSDLDAIIRKINGMNA